MGRGTVALDVDAMGREDATGFFPFRDEFGRKGEKSRARAR